MALTDKLTAIADAIRGKTGGTDALTLDAMVSAIEAIEAGGGGIPGVTVIKGEYYIMGNAFRVTIEHGLGEIKPFYFIMKIRNDYAESGYGVSVHTVIIAVPFIDTREMSYGADATALAYNPGATSRISLYSGSNVGSNAGGVIFVDSDPGSSTNYSVQMWPDGFNMGIYRNLLHGETYDYVLVYGDLFGGSE